MTCHIVEYYLCLLFPLNGFRITSILAVPFHVIIVKYILMPNKKIICSENVIIVPVCLKN